MIEYNHEKFYKRTTTSIIFIIIAIIIIIIIIIIIVIDFISTIIIIIDVLHEAACVVEAIKYAFKQMVIFHLSAIMLYLLTFSSLVLSFF